ncbi:MAG: hypothetical protein IAA73_01400 [Bacteroidetes bacterium]|uniref:Uncharacterized protein n=1 Tax=Candidatus Gallipaludibacter merdavium TaxID=2840839 RepID=A0A9D9HSK7_9BACT|nr:hypothetical protein [Candidatus Gallipaludibacter merdavium]
MIEKDYIIRPIEEKDCPALHHLYCRFSFTVVRETEEEYIMVCKLTE